MSFWRRTVDELIEEAPLKFSFPGMMLPMMGFILIMAGHETPGLWLALPIGAVGMEFGVPKDRITKEIFFAGMLLYALLGALLGYAFRSLCRAVQHKTGERQ